MTQQRTEEWHAQRCGKITGSRIAALMTKGRGNAPSVTRNDMIGVLAIERCTGKPYEGGYVNDSMLRGIQLEYEGLQAYADYSGNTIVQAAFIENPDYPNAGISPDGLVFDDGLVEVKCPSAVHKHVAALKRDEHAKEYEKQVQMQLLITGRQWCDVVSYHPAFPETSQLAVFRAYRDESLIADIAECIKKSNDEIDALVEWMERKKK